MSDLITAASPRPHVPQAFTAALAAGIALLLVACAGPGPAPTPASAPRPSTPAPTASRSDPSGPAAPVPGRRGGYYADDGPGDGPAPDPMSVPDAQPRREALSRLANRPYVVFGKNYTPMTELAPWRERGVGSWYGRKFHGLKTSSGEPYDMYGMTAAHPTLPIPSYARVTSVRTGQSVIVRVNDRGPFLHNRVIDLSWTAASKLGYAQAGSGEVEVELLTRFDGTEDAPMQMAQAGSSASGGASGGAAGSGSGGAAGGVGAGTATAQADIEPRLTVETVVNAPPASSGSAGGLSPGSSGAGATTAAPMSAASPAAAPAAAAARGNVWLQLGAFGTRDNAESARARLARQLDWLSGQLTIVPDGAMFKVQAGPYAQRDDALAAAERIKAATEFKPFPTTR